MKSIYPLFSLLFLSLSVIAESNDAPSPDAEPVFSNAWYGSLGGVTFDSGVAAEEGIEDDATLFRAGWVGEYNAFVFGAGMTFFFYSDNREFSQRVENTFGRDSTEESDADALGGFAEVGYSFKPSTYVNLDLLGGYEFLAISERAIAFCSDCREEDIDIDSGFYISPRLRITLDNGITLLGSVQHYLSGDTENAFSLGVGWGF